MNLMRLSFEFFNRDTISVARELLGKKLIRKYRGSKLSGLIVETEAYLGIRDRACHTWRGKKSKRNNSMWMAGGHAYIYMVYGMHYCFNVVTGDDKTPEAVLIRMLEPVDGIEKMRQNRGRTDNIANGPGKMTVALGIDLSLDGEDLTRSDKLWIEDGVVAENITSHQRIGIDYAGDWKDKLLRFRCPNHYMIK